MRTVGATLMNAQKCRKLLTTVLGAGALTLGCSAPAGDTNSPGSGQHEGKDKPIAGGKSDIVGGEETHAFPGVGYVTDDWRSVPCTGTLIAEKAVLTAAHCLFYPKTTTRVPTEELLFGLGTNMQNLEDPSTFRVEKVHVHPGYVPGLGAQPDDIAILVLKKRVQLTPYAIRTSAPSVGENVTVVGYGKMRGDTLDGNGIKREVDVTIAEVQQKSWRLNAVGGKTICHGDSGGPALIKNGNRYEVVGVAWKGDKNCESYAYYTRPDAYTAGFIDSFASASPANSLCSNTCAWANDGVCDDSGPGATFADCQLGTDCNDCGAR